MFRSTCHVSLQLTLLQNGLRCGFDGRSHKQTLIKDNKLTSVVPVVCLHRCFSKSQKLECRQNALCQGHAFSLLTSTYDRCEWRLSSFGEALPHCADIDQH